MNETPISSQHVLVKIPQLHLDEIRGLADKGHTMNIEDPEALKTYGNQAQEVLRMIITLPDLSTQYDQEAAGLLSRIHRLQERLDRRENTIRTLETTVKEYEEQLEAGNVALQNAQKELGETKGLLDRLGRAFENAPGASTAPAVLSPAPRRAKMPDPEKFAGDPKEFDGWLAKVQLKLSEPDSFIDEAHKARYVIGLLSGSAYDQIRHLITDTGVNVTFVTELTALLKNAFADPDPRGTARRALNTCYQKHRRFVDFLAEITRYFNTLEMDNNSRKLILEEHLSIELKTAIANADTVPEEYDAMVEWLIKKDTRLAAFTASRSKNIQATRNSNYSTPHRQYAPTTPQRPTTAAHPTNSNSGYYGPAPMDLSAGRGRITDAERNRRRAAGLCLYCGGSGHLAFSCPNKRPPPMRGSVGVVGAGREKVEVSDEEEVSKN